MSFPVLEILPELKGHLARQPIVVLEAPPGAGKSTVLPIHLLAEPWLENRKIIMLEPRRLAARNVAMRLAEMMGEEIGKTVGYRVRFETVTSADTRLEVVTEGIFTRMIQSDNALEGIGMVIFDEFHERSVQADLSFALARQSQALLRDDLRILIMSATLNLGQLAQALKGIPVTSSQGRQYPVEKKYIVPDKSLFFTDQVVRCIRKAFQEETGDILVFLPGVGDILRVATGLDSMDLNTTVHTLYGDLPFKKQQEAILPDPAGSRKIVLSTSIAETSLTIEGVRVIVDGGFSRVPRFDLRSGLTRLETIKVTQDAADQRCGRAGRLSPGVCYRMWPEHEKLVPHRKPEIEEVDLASLVLELARWGIKDPLELEWITPPPTGLYAQALELLQQLEALEGTSITEKGKRMANLPTHPRIGHLLLEAEDQEKRFGRKGLLALATDIAALLEEKDPMGRNSDVDLTRRIELLRRWRNKEGGQGERQVLERIEKLAQAWRKLFRIGEDNTPPSDKETGLLLFTAYPDRLSRQLDKNGDRYKMSNGNIVKLPDHDPFCREPWLVAVQADAGKKEGKIFMAAPVDVEDLLPLAQERERVEWDEERGMVSGVREKHIGVIVLSSRVLTTIKDEDRIRLLCAQVQEKGLGMLGWSDEHENWQARAMSLRAWRPHEEWPDVSTAGLLKNIHEWLPPFLTQANKKQDLLRLDLWGIIHSLLPYPLASKLNELAPERIEVPSQSMIRVRYSENGNPPEMDVRLQEVFGLVDTPAVNEGKNKLILHLLSPGYKPVQVTQDLKSFWSNTYQEVRKQLRARYPKHSWPEDPWTAKAVRKGRSEPNR